MREFYNSHTLQIPKELLCPQFLSSPKTEQIEQAIAHLETQTSAELRVVVEHKNTSKFDAIARAEQLFDELNMRETQDRNGVLIYLAFKPHHLAVIGDQGIHEKVEKDFWQAVYEVMKKRLQLGNYTQAICDGIAPVISPIKPMM